MDENEFKSYINDFINKYIEENFELNNLEKDFKGGFNQLDEKQKENLFFLMFVAKDHTEILREVDTEKSVYLLGLMKDSWNAGRQCFAATGNLSVINLGELLHNDSFLSELKRSIELFGHMNQMEKKVKDMKPEISEEELKKTVEEYYEKIKPKFGF